jgi:hypothetical protein
MHSLLLVRALAAAASLVIGAALLPIAAHAQAPAATPMIAELLFVQSAAAVEIDEAKNTLTLKGLSPTTLFFSDRPVRIAGHYRTEEYLDFWKKGPDSFLKDPPNATLSVFEKGKDEMSDVVVTLRNPRVSGNEITYDVTVISGTLPKAGGPASLFIDIIGLPFTPLSFAGVARRTAYRTAVYGSALAASPYYYHPPAVYSVAPVVTVPAPVTYHYTAPVPPPVQVTETGPLPIGAVVAALPPGCVSSPSNGIQYYDCAGTYYRAAVQGESIRYMVVQHP